MNPLKQISRYTTFNDSLTDMDVFKDISLKMTLAKSAMAFIRELPLCWLLLLCLLLFVNDAVAEAQSTKVTIISSELANSVESANLVILDRSVEQVESLLSGFRGDLHLLILEDDNEPFEQINQALSAEPLYSNVTIIAKASSSAIYLGGRWIDQHYLLEYQQTLATFAKQFANDSQLSLYTTNLTVSHGGGEFIGLFENLTQLNVDVIYMQGQHYEPLWVQRAEFDF
ncbi:DUF4347 domain-containing protein [Shewanella sp. 0m-8]